MIDAGFCGNLYENVAWLADSSPEGSLLHHVFLI